MNYMLSDIKNIDESANFNDDTESEGNEKPNDSVFVKTNHIGGIMEKNDLDNQSNISSLKLNYNTETKGGNKR